MTNTPVEISRPTVQYTLGGHANVQFQRRSARTGTWEHYSYQPTQADWARHAPPEIAALAEQHPSLAGFWSDAEVEADLRQYLAEEYGWTDVVFVDSAPAQPDVPVELTTLEKAAPRKPTH